MPRFPGAQSASLHPESPRGLLKVNSRAAWGSVSAEADGRCLCCSVLGSALGKRQFVADSPLLSSIVPLSCIGISYSPSFCLSKSYSSHFPNQTGHYWGWGFCFRLVSPAALGWVPVTWSRGDWWVFVGLLINVHFSPWERIHIGNSIKWSENTLFLQVFVA